MSKLPPFNAAWLAGIFDIAIDAIIVVDRSQRILFFNQGAEYTFGYTMKEMLGQSLARLLPERFRTAHEQHIERFAGEPHTSQHMHERSPIWGRRKNGEEFPCEASISKVEREGELAFAVILRDITERRQMEDSLHHALAEARELSELRSRFISMVSHELRTPLSVILTSSHILESYGLQMSPEQRLEYHDNIKQQVRHLTKLLEDTLAVSRAETVGLDFVPEPGDLERFCRDTATKLQLTTNQTPRILFTTSGGCQIVRFDEQLLWLILSNLLSNALKYSPDGGTIAFTLDCHDGQAVIEIRDQGIGIPADDQTHLFESFHRGTNVGAIPGTGLGLAIVGQAVRAHGGSITFTSAEGAGTTFTVTLPVA